MLIQERIDKQESLLKLYVEIDEQVKEVYKLGESKQLPKDARGQKAKLSISEIITIMVWGMWLGLSDKAKLYYEIKRSYFREFPLLTSYSKFVEATNRVSREVAAILAKIIAKNRADLADNKIVNQDSTILPVCKVSRANSHKVFRNFARKSKNGSGYWYGLKLHLQCDQAGNIWRV